MLSMSKILGGTVMVLGLKDEFDGKLSCYMNVQHDINTRTTKSMESEGPFSAPGLPFLFNN